MKFKADDRVRILNSEDTEAIGKVAVITEIDEDMYDILYFVEYEDENLKKKAEFNYLQDIFREEDLEFENVLKPDMSVFKPMGYINIKFQEGAILENGVNGAQIEDVIDVLVSRLEGFQKGGFPCRENALAITKLEEARMWLNERTRKRKKQGVEGKDENHK